MSEVPKSTKELIDIAQKEGVYTEYEATELKKIWEDLKPLQSQSATEWELQFKSRLKSKFGPRQDHIITTLRQRTEEAKRKRNHLQQPSSQLAPPRQMPLSTMPSALSADATTASSSSAANETSAVLVKAEDAKPAETQKAKGPSKAQRAKEAKEGKEPKEPKEPKETKEGPKPKSTKASKSKSQKASAAAGSQATDFSTNAPTGTDADTSGIAVGTEGATKDELAAEAAVEPVVLDEAEILRNELDSITERLGRPGENVMKSCAEILASDVIADEEAAAADDMRKFISSQYAFLSDAQSPRQQSPAMSRAGNPFLEPLPIWARASAGPHPIMSTNNIQTIFFNMKSIHFLKANRNKAEAIRFHATTFPVHNRLLYPAFPAPFSSGVVSTLSCLPMSNTSSSVSGSMHNAENLTHQAAALISAAIQLHLKNIIDQSIRHGVHRSIHDGFGAVEDIVNNSSHRSSIFGKSNKRVTLKLAGIKRGFNVKGILDQEERYLKMYLERTQLLQASVSDNGGVFAGADKSRQKRDRGTNDDDDSAMSVDRTTDGAAGGNQNCIGEEGDDEEDGVEEFSRKKRLCTDEARADKGRDLQQLRPPLPVASSSQNNDNSNSDTLLINKRDLVESIHKASASTGIGFQSSLSAKLS